MWIVVWWMRYIYYWSFANKKTRCLEGKKVTSIILLKPVLYIHRKKARISVEILFKWPNEPRKFYNNAFISSVYTFGVLLGKETVIKAIIKPHDYSKSTNLLTEIFFWKREPWFSNTVPTQSEYTFSQVLETQTILINVILKRYIFVWRHSS